jgi:hypothetical protein
VRESNLGLSTNFEGDLQLLDKNQHYPMHMIKGWLSLKAYNLASYLYELDRSALLLSWTIQK